MVELKELNIEENTSIIIQRDGQNQRLFSSARYTGEVGECSIGGFAINHTFEVDGVKKGFLYFIQEVKEHHFICKDSEGKNVKEILVDASDNAIIDSIDRQFFYRRHLVENNEIKAYDMFGDKYQFQDAPFFPVEEDWVTIDFHIAFRTHIAWTNTVNEIQDLTALHPICSFGWISLWRHSWKMENGRLSRINSHQTRKYWIPSTSILHWILI